MPNWSESSILVVDDSALQREFVVALLHDLGFVYVLQAGDGVQALQILESKDGPPVDFVLSDLDMPGMDGIELMRVIAEKKWAQNLIVMTARDPRLLDAVESMAVEDKDIRLLGALRKPLSREQLAQVLARVPGKRHTGESGEVNLFSLEAIRQGVEQGEFVPWYQPKVDMTTGLLKGVEALARWNHPEYGLVAPMRFIPVLEADNSGLMQVFTFALLKQVLIDVAEWNSRGLVLSASVNLSAQALVDSALADKLAEMLAAAQVPTRSLILEVTETTVMNHLAASIGNLARLRLKGFGLSMDDYGTGYSSMQQLSRCPFTELKIDRSFVHGAVTHPNRRVILESSIEMGRRLNVTTVAEGVETKEDWRLLKELGCELGQGYFAAKPMPAVELIDWYQANRQRLASIFE